MCSIKVSSDVWRVHCVTGGEPVVLFQRGAVRLLDSLLSAPQQPVEEVLTQEEAIRADREGGFRKIENVGEFER